MNNTQQQTTETEAQASPETNNTAQSTNGRESYYNFNSTIVGKLHFIPGENGRPLRVAIRKITPKNGDPYWGVKLSAMDGKKSEPAYVPCDLTYGGDSQVSKDMDIILARALEMVEKTGNRQTVNVHLVIGGIRPKSYPFKKDGKEETRTFIGGRLLRVDRAWLSDEQLVGKSTPPVQTDGVEAEAATS